MDKLTMTNPWIACREILRQHAARQPATRSPQVGVRTAAIPAADVHAALPVLPGEAWVQILQALTAADLVRFKRVSVAAKNMVDGFFTKALEAAAWKQAVARWPEMESEMARSKLQLADIHSDSAIDRLVAWFGPDVRRIAEERACVSLNMDSGRQSVLASLPQLLASRKILFIRFEMDKPEDLALLPAQALSESGKKIGLDCAVDSPEQRQTLHAFMRQVPVSFLSMHGGDVDRDAALECAQRFPDTQILAISQSRNERCVHVLNIDAGSEKIAQAMVELQMHADIRRYHALGIFQMGEDRQTERALSGRRYYLFLHGDKPSQALLRAMLASLPSSASIGTVHQNERQLRAQIIVEHLDPLI